MPPKSRILVVDDEHSMREMVSILLSRHGYDVQTARSGNEAIGLFEAGEHFDLIVTDLIMDRGDGLSVLAGVKKSLPECDVIVITAFGTAESAVEAMKAGAFDYVTKPFNVDEFLIIVRQALERQALIRENLVLRARIRGETELDDIVGRSPAMKELIALCRKVADTQATVLISGESGTGKEVVARALHFSSSRADKPFIAVNCGALPEQLMESELFGHQKGAFTGATEDKIGLFGSSDGGTIFLDEIGELPLALQVKMLRVLESHKIRPVGQSEEIPINIRVVAATNQDLARKVKEGEFRKDLFYRLNVIHIELPPLRKRTEDIPLLVEHLLVRIARESGGEKKRLTTDAMRFLSTHNYPGNVRELANILERGAMLATGDVIDLSDLAPERIGHLESGFFADARLPENGIDLDQALSAYERNLIEQALDRTGGKLTQAAQLLHVSFRSLRYRVQKLELGTDEDTS